MREIRTSGLMSGDGRRGNANWLGYRAHPRLYLPCFSSDAEIRLAGITKPYMGSSFYFVNTNRAGYYCATDDLAFKITPASTTQTSEPASLALLGLGLIRRSRA